jgi:aryl-alcohol dehydrogenase-like predicted oxidoreductase
VVEAVEHGVTMVDVAPAYGNGEAEIVVGEALGGAPPSGVRIATKCALFARWSPVKDDLQRRGLQPQAIESAIERSLEASQERLRHARIDLLFLHDPFVADREQALEPGITRSLYADVVRPMFEGLVAKGRIGAWGISGTGTASAVLQALSDEPRPYAIQIEANALRSRSASGSSEIAPGATELIAASHTRGLGVMGIRPTQSGALTSGFDRAVDAEWEAYFRRASGFRSIAEELHTPPAELAHRYALSIVGLSTVTLGVKNRSELRQALAAEAASPLPPELVERIDATLALGHQ